MLSLFLDWSDYNRMKQITLYLIILLALLSCKDKVLLPPDVQEGEYVIVYEHLGDIYIYNTLDHSQYNLTESLVDTFYHASVSEFFDSGEELLFTLDYMKAGEEELQFSRRDDIFVHNILTGETQRITNNEYREINPVFSKDGQTIIYQSFENGNSDIFSMRRDGSNKKLIVGGDGIEWNPALSHDGQRLFYRSIRNDKEDIYVNDIDGGNEINLTSSPLCEGNPAISRDGEFIAYEAIESIIDVGNFDKGLFRLDLFNLHKTQIVPGSDGVTGFSMPKLSMDSQQIAARYFDGSWLYVYLMDIDGENQVKIAKGRDMEFTQDDKYLIYLGQDGLHKFDLSNKKDELILDQEIGGHNIEVAAM